MKKISIAVLIIWVSLSQPNSYFAQQSPTMGSIKIIGMTGQTGSRVRLERKRFYLLRGGLEDHKELIERLNANETISRDCYYKNLNVSPQYMCWLKTEEYNCESPYCREITMEDIETVPEFMTAYQRGMRQFGGRTELARGWLTTNLPFELREGFYRQQKSALDSLLEYAKPVQTIMTDPKQGIAYFIDIPLNLGGDGDEKKAEEKFLITNLLPIEIGDMSFVWACETEVGGDKQETFNLLAGERSKTKCVVIKKDLPVCRKSGCEDTK